jgi:ATP-binding cassette, subfamily B, bacterial
MVEPNAGSSVGDAVPRFSDVIRRRLRAFLDPNPVRRIQVVRQYDSSDCGICCLAMVLEHWGRPVSREELIALTNPTRNGLSLEQLRDAALALRTSAEMVCASLEELEAAKALPCVLHWSAVHFVVLVERRGQSVTIIDPAVGRRRISRGELHRRWERLGQRKELGGNALVVRVNTDQADPLLGPPRHRRIRYLVRYLRAARLDRRSLLTFAMLALAGLSIQAAMPLLSMALIDKGIGGRAMEIVLLIAGCQAVLSISRTAAFALRDRVLHRFGARLQRALVSLFLSGIEAQPLRFFETRTLGDILQRAGDAARVRQLLVMHGAGTLFGVVTLAMFGTALLWVSPAMFVVFLATALTYLGIIWSMSPQRTVLTHRQTVATSVAQSALVEYVAGVRDLRLFGALRLHHGKWRLAQKRMAHLDGVSMRLEQKQFGLAGMVNELRTIVITAIGAGMVLNSEMTFGALLATHFIVGQLSVPLAQMANLAIAYAGSRLSVDRLQELDRHVIQPSERRRMAVADARRVATPVAIEIRDLCFAYPGSRHAALHDVSMVIPGGQTTALIGASGSGKSTLIRLLVKFSEPSDGEILVDGVDLRSITEGEWYPRCSAALQDGYVFNASITANVALNEIVPDERKVLKSLQYAGMASFVAGLPDQTRTMIGGSGLVLSAGQRQRILIARALYKRAGLLILDEATSALDPATERSVLQDIMRTTVGMTKIIVSHRPSTMRYVDNVIVLNEGRVVEAGHPTELRNNGGAYSQFVASAVSLPVKDTVQS